MEPGKFSTAERHFPFGAWRTNIFNANEGCGCALGFAFCVYPEEGSSWKRSENKAIPEI